MEKTKENLYGMTKTEFLTELERHIQECYSMIDHYIQLDNKEEIAVWRRYLQIAKIQKRRVVSM